MLLMKFEAKMEVQGY